MKKIGQIKHIGVFCDNSMKQEDILIARKSSTVMEPGYVYIPNENFKNVKGSPIEKSEVDKILKKQHESALKEYKKSGLDAITFVVGGSNDFEVYEKFLNKLVQC